MMNPKKIRMKREYEQLVNLVCGEDWSMPETPEDERDGGMGVAMVLAYMKGVEPKITEFSSVLGIPPYMLEISYMRIKANGLLSSESWVLSDPHLKGANDKDPSHVWCHIAGLASGFVGRKGLSRAEYFEKSRRN